mgnify:CR=1 FL=1
MAKVLAENPANRFGLGHRKGKLAVGYDADFIIVDPTEVSILDEEKMHSNAGWSPYNGMEIHGKVKRTYIRGKEVYNGQVVGEKGDGTFIPAIYEKKVFAE